MSTIFKIFSLSVRVFARPVIHYIKQIHLDDEQKINKHLRTWFIFLGNHYNRFEEFQTKINRKFLRIETNEDFFVKPLKDDVAIKKGVEIFYEIIIYTIMITFPLYEIYFFLRKSREDNLRREAILKKLDEDLCQLKQKRLIQQSEISLQLEQTNLIYQQMNNQLENLFTEIKDIVLDLQQFQQKYKQIQIRKNQLQIAQKKNETEETNQIPSKEEIQTQDETPSSKNQEDDDNLQKNDEQ